ncbi:MAG: beta-ureidopropionase [Candidatus Eremiobacteraeota bacterium]|nr:beta-ureidopropionase [Candidatus Eremiobacteraeota bacterium]MBC5828401.1 beta-ureidopropionase [Candidatus Eremiobacteraeota bacterium]
MENLDTASDYDALGIVPKPASRAIEATALARKPLRLGLVQFAPRKGDVQANLRSIGHALEALADDCEPFPDVIVFPETSLSGYFVEGGVRDVAFSAEEALDRLARVAREACPKKETFDIVLGFYEAEHGKHYNSALYATLGARVRLHHVHRKLFLPTYGVFDEERFVSRGRAIDSFETAYGRAAILICEDACHSLATTVAALRGASIIFIPSASPGRGLEDGEPANVRMWRDIMRVVAAEHGVYMAYAGLVGFEGGKGFTGGSRLVGPFGDLRAEAPFSEAAILRVDVSMADVASARAALPMLGDLESNLSEIAAMLAKLAGPRAPSA